jgi:hypothetical protein
VEEAIEEVELVDHDHGCDGCGGSPGLPSASEREGEDVGETLLAELGGSRDTIIGSVDYVGARIESLRLVADHEDR